MPTDPSKNNVDTSNNNLIIQPNVDNIVDPPPKLSPHIKNISDRATRRNQMNQSIIDLIKKIKNDIEKTETIHLNKLPDISNQHLEHYNKNTLDHSKEDKNIKNENDDTNISGVTKPHRLSLHHLPILNNTNLSNCIVKQSSFPPQQQPNDIKHNASTNINMRIEDLIKHIKETREPLARNKINKHYSRLSLCLDNKPPSIPNSLFSKSTIVPHKTPANRDKVDSLTAHINNLYNLKYSSPLFHGNKLFDATKNYHNFLQSKPSPLIRQPIHIKLPTAPKRIEKKQVAINVEISSLGDLLKLIDDYPIQYDVEYNINMEAMNKIKEPLLELNHMIGMDKLKNSIVDQIIYFIQDLHCSKTNSGDFMHTCIYGPPGTGKTEVAKIMGKIYSNLGVLKKNVFKKVTRSDLIAGYLGQTAIKTRDIVKECLGGVMFIDEAYALGNSEKRDSFAKECIDTLCEALSDHKHDLMVIIAGYEHELKKCFFAYNQGLDSRFTWRFKTDDYNPDELRKIFIKKIHDAGWTMEKEGAPLSWFESNIDYFKYFGRDMETLFSKIKIAHSRRVFCLPKDKKKCIIFKDLEKGFSHYLDNDEVKGRKDDPMEQAVLSMYN